MTFRRPLAIAALLAAALTAAQPASGQSTDPPGTGPASPLLPPGHWAVEAAARLEAMGLAPDHLPAQAAVPRSAVADALKSAAARVESDREERGRLDAGRRDEERRRAAEHAATDRPSVQLPSTGPVASMVRGWWRRFAAEFPEFGGPGAADPTAETRQTGDTAGAPAVALLGGSAGAGLEMRKGAAGPGLGEFMPDLTGATPLPDRTRAVGRGEAAVGVGGWGAAYIAPMVRIDGARIERAELVLGWRGIRASIGRAEIGWGVGRGGGVIFSGLLPLDRVEISTAAPVRLPGWLELLGPFAFHAFTGPLPSARHPGSPWLAGGSASAKPHPRFTISVHRALVAGGAGVDERMGAGEVFEALIGRNVVGVNQIASTSFRFRLPTEGVIPISVYCEWGAEDTAGAPFDAPGLICGGASPSLPPVPTMTLGLEHAQLGARPANGPPWYRHHMFPGNWAMDEGTLGHPLGGEGRQWLVYSRMSAFGGTLDLDGSAFLRTRTGENLYLPGRAGESRGLMATAVWRVHPRAELRLAGSREAGDGWAESHLEIFSRMLF